VTTATQTFASKAPWIMDQLMKDFGLTLVQASGVLGNLGHECDGFTKLQELHPLGGGRGGLGWAQWTADRRRTYEAYCARNHLDPKDDKANYGFMFNELKGAYSKAITHLKTTTSIDGAVRQFEKDYEAAGVKDYPSRNKWAMRALDAHGQKDDVIEKVQKRLNELGLKTIVGEIDGIDGPRTKEGITAFQLCHGGLVVDGIAGPETRKALGL
jgi:hypothetical protein